jgi:glycosyltransferase involved in cell wall biosynthesis
VKNHLPRCVLVIPCYNEAARLPLKQLEAFLLSTDWVEFLFVDDGSSDDTWNLLAEFSLQSRCNALRMEKNSGKGEAVRQGVLKAMQRVDVDYVGYWDADLATPLNELAKMTQILDAETATLAVIGSRVRMLGREISRKPLRHYVGRVFSTLASLAIGLPVYDTQCGAKVFRKSGEVSCIFSQPFRDRWSFDVELLKRLFEVTQDSNCAIELPLRNWKDVGASTVSLRGGLKAFASLFGIWRAGKFPGEAVVKKAQSAADLEEGINSQKTSTAVNEH